MITNYEPGIIFQRTPDENRDMFLAWQRPDKAFFAAGACHILAHMFLSLHHGEGYEFIYIKPKGDYPGNHHVRPPEYFPELPWRRAYDYIRQFPAEPPK